MKAIFKKATAVIAAAVMGTCMIISVGAYTPMGGDVTYKVSSQSPTWNNQNSNYAWDLQSTRDCYFKGTVPNGIASFSLKQWTFNYDSVTVWSAGNRSGNFIELIPGTMMPADDYFATVTHVSGGTITGKVTLS